MKKSIIKKFTLGLIAMSTLTSLSACIAMYGFLNINVLSGLLGTAVMGYGIHSTKKVYDRMMSHLK